MAEHDDEREVSRRYRELPREEPSPRLDEAIRAQARRAGGARPAPLVPPTGRRSWHYPVAAAAMIVLVVAVTWQVDRERPDFADGTVAESGGTEKAAEKQDQAPAVAAQQKQEAPQTRPDNAPRRRELARKPAEQAAGAPQAPAAPPAPAAAPSAESLEKRSMARAQVADAEKPEQWLERIARLRREGRHEEADKALAEFRKRYPDFTIPPAMLEQVEKK